MPDTTPVNTTAPALTGIAQNGQFLVCTTGSWTGGATFTYGYTWKRNNVAIAGATANNYVPGTSDVGQSIRCTVSASNTAGSASADSNTVTPTTAGLGAPAPSGAIPLISGSPAVGATVSCTTGGWLNSPTGYVYQWLRAGVPIGGATASSYVLQSADEGQTITCRVVGYNADGAGTAALSSNSVTVTGATPFRSYTFGSAGAGGTRAFHAYTFTAGTLKASQALAGTSAGASSDSGTLGTAFGVKLLDALSAGASGSSGDLLRVPMPRHPVWIRTSEGWQILTPAVGYFTSATHAAGTTILVPRATHQLHATRGLMVTVHDETTGAQEVADVIVGANGDVGVSFTTSAPANSKRVTVIGPYT